MHPLSIENGSNLVIQKKFGNVRHLSFNKSYHSETTSDKSSLLSSFRIEELLSDALNHRYQTSGEILVKLASSWKPLEIRSSSVLKIKDVSPDELCSSCFVRFSLWDAGVKVGDFSFPIRIAHMQEVYFANKSLQRGSKLNENDFKLFKVDVLKQHANSVSFQTNLRGFELQSNLSANSPLKWSILSKANLINKGQVVDVYASGKGIYVTMKGVALEDGVADSFVKIRNLSSDKEFQAKVLNESSVKVHL